MVHIVDGEEDHQCDGKTTSSNTRNEIRRQLSKIDTLERNWKKSLSKIGLT